MKVKTISVLAIAAVTMLFSCADDNPVTPPETPEEPPVEVKDTTVRTDETLCRTFSKALSFGSKGCIRIFRYSDDKQVDYVDMADLSTVTIREDGQMIPNAQMKNNTTTFNTLMDAIGYGSYRRIVHCTPVRLDGNTLKLKPHSGALDYNTQYYIQIEDGAVEGASTSGKEWSFRTGVKPESKSEVSVAQSGKADFRTVQGAIEYAASCGQSTATTISIAEGTYNELLYIRSNNNLTLKAAGSVKPEISYANCEHYANGTGGYVSAVPAIGAAISKNGGRAVVLVESCDMLCFENLILRNSFGSTAGQAEVIYNNDSSGKYRLIMKGCELYSYQDTFLTKGYALLSDCIIAGHCDYVWGYPKACLFDNCEIRSLAKGYIVQCRCQSLSDVGFVFLNCRLTSDQSVLNGTMTLGRSGGAAGNYDNVTFVNCSISPAFTIAGWYTDPKPTPSSPTATAGWKEYGSTDLDGKPLLLSGRTSYSRILSSDEAAAFSSRDAVFASAPFTDKTWYK